MLIRAIVLLVVVATVSIGLSWAFGAEVLAALGLVLAQIKIVLGKMAAVSSKALLTWLRVQGINFARVEIAKRWLLKSLVPMLIGAALQRRIMSLFKVFAGSVRTRFDALMTWYRSLHRSLRIIAILIACFATLGLAVTSMSLWLLLFSVQMPFWIIAGLAATSELVWRYVQKLVFRTIAFMKLYRVWGFVRNRLPEAYRQRLRRFNFRVARIVVKRRRMTVAQLTGQRDGIALRLAFLREYFRHRRPEVPTGEELDGLRRTRDPRAEASGGDI